MEEHICLFPANGYIGGCSLRDGIRGRGDVLVLFILGELLVVTRLYRLIRLSVFSIYQSVYASTHGGLPDISIRDSQLESSQSVSHVFNFRCAYLGVFDGLHRLFILILHANLLASRGISHIANLGLRDLAWLVFHEISILRVFGLFSFALLLFLSPRFFLLGLVLLVDSFVALVLLLVEMLDKFLDSWNGIGTTPVLSNAVSLRLPDSLLSPGSHGGGLRSQ